MLFWPSFLTVIVTSVARGRHGSSVGGHGSLGTPDVLHNINAWKHHSYHYHCHTWVIAEIWKHVLSWNTSSHIIRQVVRGLQTVPNYQEYLQRLSISFVLFMMLFFYFTLFRGEGHVPVSSERMQLSEQKVNVGITLHLVPCIIDLYWATDYILILAMVILGCLPSFGKNI